MRVCGKCNGSGVMVVEAPDRMLEDELEPLLLEDVCDSCDGEGVLR